MHSANLDIPAGIYQLKMYHKLLQRLKLVGAPHAHVQDYQACQVDQSQAGHSHGKLASLQL